MSVMVRGADDCADSFDDEVDRLVGEYAATLPPAPAAPAPGLDRLGLGRLVLADVRRPFAGTARAAGFEARWVGDTLAVRAGAGAARVTILYRRPPGAVGHEMSGRFVVPPELYRAWRGALSAFALPRNSPLAVWCGGRRVGHADRVARDGRLVVRTRREGGAEVRREVDYRTTRVQFSSVDTTEPDRWEGLTAWVPVAGHLTPRVRDAAPGEWAASPGARPRAAPATAALGRRGGVAAAYAFAAIRRLGP